MIEPLKGANQLIFHKHLHMREKRETNGPIGVEKKPTEREIRRLIVKKMKFLGQFNMQMVLYCSYT